MSLRNNQIRALIKETSPYGPYEAPEYVEFTGTITEETERAVCAEFKFAHYREESVDTWLPKSQIEITAEHVDGTVTIKMPSWLDESKYLYEAIWYEEQNCVPQSLRDRISVKKRNGEGCFITVDGGDPQWTYLEPIPNHSRFVAHIAELAAGAR